MTTYKCAEEDITGRWRREVEAEDIGGTSHPKLTN
jgi:hypothetical protein